MLDALGRDLRYAGRLARRSPGFACTVVVTLALAIGANAAVFSLTNAILLRALPYPDPDRLAYVDTRVASAAGQSSDIGQDGRGWIEIRDRATLIDRAVYGDGFSDGINLVVGRAAEIVRQQRVSAGYFHVLGVAPFIGREFSPDEDRPGGPAAVVLSYPIWQRTFQHDRDIVGTRILLRGEPYTVVGVMPESFVNLWPTDVWTPVRATTTGEGAGTNFEVIARLKPGVTWAQAEGDLASISPAALSARFGNELEKTDRATLGLRPMQDALVENARQPIVMLEAAVGAVLLIACVNLAALLMARGRGRAREIATRMALGGGRAAVVRQLMTEAIVLAAAGGLLGLFAGWAGLDGLKALGGGTFDEWRRVTLDGPVVALTMGLTAVTSLVFGLVPALQASRLDVQAALAEGGSRAVAGGPRHWARRALVVAEVALGVVLLVVAGLLLRTFVGLRGLDPGFDPDGLATASVSLLDKRYEAPAVINHLFDESVAAIEATPGVVSASVSLGLPYNRLLNMGFRLTDVPPTDRGLIANVSYVTPDFFKTLAIPVRQGRPVTAADRDGGLPVAVVNQSFVRIYSSDRDPLGRRIRLSGVEREIVGVAGDVQQRGAGFFVGGMVRGPLTDPPIVYVPAAQAGGIFSTHIWFQPVWTVRATSMAVAGPAIVRAIAGVDPLLPVGAPQSMSSIMTKSTAQQRLLMTLVGVLAAAAILLAAIGIQGLIAQTVAEREREFGIRLALGATAGHTVRQVAMSGIALAAGGAVIGGGLSVPSVTLVQAFLWGVGARDPATYIGVAGFLLVVAAVASTLPALAIAKLDPARMLRE